MNLQMLCAGNPSSEAETSGMRSGIDRKEHLTGGWNCHTMSRSPGRAESNPRFRQTVTGHTGALSTLGCGIRRQGVGGGLDFMDKE